MWLRWVEYSMFLLLVVLLSMVLGSQAARADCKGCLCPGDPCRLCPLPPHTDDPVPADEPETCRRVREIVPPDPALPGSNEYFANLDKATLACIRNGGDVIKNSRRSELFPARVYCKPDLFPH
jgi:hypothetical protein